MLLILEGVGSNFLFQNGTHMSKFVGLSGVIAEIISNKCQMSIKENRKSEVFLPARVGKADGVRCVPGVDNKATGSNRIRLGPRSHRRKDVLF